MRVALKKEFLDRLSMVLCIHRVYDFKFLGIPNMRAEGAQLALLNTTSKKMRCLVRFYIFVGEHFVFHLWYTLL